MNPLLEKREYEVKLSDGLTVEYAVNVIAENLYLQCDSGGHKFLLIKEIIGWAQKDNAAILKDDGFVISKNGNKVKQRMTNGWMIGAELKDGSEMKALNAIVLAEYVVANKLVEELAFGWWCITELL